MLLIVALLILVYHIYFFFLSLNLVTLSKNEKKKKEAWHDAIGKAKIKYSKWDKVRWHGVLNNNMQSNNLIFKIHIQ